MPFVPMLRAPKKLYRATLIDHLLVAYSVTWPLNGSEAGGDLAFDTDLSSFVI